MPRKARSNENSNPDFLLDQRRGNGGPTMLRPRTGLLGTVNKKKKILLNANTHGERAFAREIQNLVSANSDARYDATSPNRATGGGLPMGVIIENDFVLRVVLGLASEPEQFCGLQRLAEGFEALDLQDERPVPPPSLPVIQSVEAEADASITAATTVSSRVSSFLPVKPLRNPRARGRPPWERDVTDCPFCSLLGVAPASASSDQARPASVDTSVSGPLRCRCHRYSRVFNRRNSFRSIVSQSTPVARTVHLVQCALDSGLGAQESQVSDVSRASLGTQGRDSASGQPEATRVGADDTGTTGRTMNSFSGTTMAQLATQLNACTLSPCADSDFYAATQCAGGTDGSGSSRALGPRLSTLPSTRSLSLSLGYIHAAFPLQEQEHDFRLDF